MKTTLIIGCLSLNLLLSWSGHGQANYALRNLDSLRGVNAPVLDAQGAPLAGSNYLAELWGAATPDSLTPAVVFDQGNRREIVPFQSGGYFISGAGFLSVLAVPPNGFAWLQVRAWDGRLGDTYEEVVALGIGGYGESPLFYAQGGNAFDVLAFPPPLTGLQSFSLLPVIPEPSGAALFLFGALALIAFRRWSGK